MLSAWLVGDDTSPIENNPYTLNNIQNVLVHSFYFDNDTEDSEHIKLSLYSVMEPVAISKGTYQQLSSDITLDNTALCITRLIIPMQMVWLR